MATIQPREAVFAYTKLLSYVGQKRRGIKEEFGTDPISDIAFNFNNSIKNNYNLDVFAIDESDPESLNKYSEIVYERILEISEIEFINEETKEESKAINDSFPLSSQDLIHYNIGSANAARGINLNISSEEISKYIRTSENIIGIGPDEVAMIVLTTKRIEYQNKPAVLLTMGAVVENKTVLAVHLALLFFEEEFLQLVDLPIKLFFRAIQRFGSNIGFRNTKRKFFYKTILPGNQLIGLPYIDGTFFRIGKVERYQNEDVNVTHSQLFDGKTLHIYFYFAISVTKYNKYIQQFS